MRLRTQILLCDLELEYLKQRRRLKSDQQLMIERELAAIDVQLQTLRLKREALWKRSDKINPSSTFRKQRGIEWSNR